MKPRRVLVTPLDWGLGHAARCAPVIQELMDMGCEVMIGGSGEPLALIKKEFPSLPCFRLSPYAPVYSRSGSQVWKMATQLSGFIRTIYREHRETGQLVREKKIDVVISDNRYGCWSRESQNVFITHQVNIQLPGGLKWMEGPLNHINHKLIRNFHHCWVPDRPGEHSLSGILSQSDKLKVRYIGPLSRLEILPVQHEKKYDLIAVLSGPEPQRSILEKIMLDEAAHIDKQVCIVRGTAGNAEGKTDRNILIFDLLSSHDLQQALQQSRLLIARSGYSTIMDLAQIGGKAIFIPTPGQTEQEYLAQRFMEKGIAFFMRQDQFDLVTAIRESEKYSGFYPSNGSGGLRQALHELLNYTEQLNEALT